MAFKMQQALILTVLLSLFSISLATSEIAVYWGQNDFEGSLEFTCSLGKYSTVNLGFLNVFGSNKTPEWNFAGHCSNWESYSPSCSKLVNEIKQCQQNSVKVFLSLGGPTGSYSLSSAEDAKEVASYLYDNFLSGKPGPLGTVVALDGINFNIQAGSNEHWDDLATELDALRKEKHFHLSASPTCALPDYYLDSAIKTGLFDEIYVRFFDNPSCQFSFENSAYFFQSWDAWTSYVANSTVFLGLSAGPSPSSTGFIPPPILDFKVLPYVKVAPNYGGVVLWDRALDAFTFYSDFIRFNVQKNVLQSVTQVSNE